MTGQQSCKPIELLMLNRLGAVSALGLVERRYVSVDVFTAAILSSYFECDSRLGMLLIDSENGEELVHHAGGKIVN